MKLFVNGAPETLPADWSLRIDLDDLDRRQAHVQVEREGKFMPLGEALALRDCLVISSRPEVRKPI